MDDTYAIAAVICAAGSSTRMGGEKKEYRHVGKPADSLTVLGSAVSAFALVPSVKTIVIAVPANGEEEARKALPPGILSAESPKVHFVAGGSSRRASVFNALSFFAASANKPRYVLIHDGARPWVSPSLIAGIIEAVKIYGAVIPLLPLTDTPKECDAPLQITSACVCEHKGGAVNRQAAALPVFIERHLKRVNTGIAQTPQAFAFPGIFAAHEKAAEVEGEEFTDDAEIWGRFCGAVAVIPGEPENRKITFKEDLI